MDNKLSFDELAPAVAECTVSVRELSPKPIPGEPDATTSYMAMSTHIGDGEIDGTAFALRCSLTGNLEVSFASDFQNGRFLICAHDFIQAAYLVYAKKTER